MLKLCIHHIATLARRAPPPSLIFMSSAQHKTRNTAEMMEMMGKEIRRTFPDPKIILWHLRTYRRRSLVKLTHQTA
ncbi:hypothetical protein N7504_001764 [Penicillium tannophilum]|nr:hypothetical protein N7504_001764 [Penicillium tannophilum]